MHSAELRSEQRLILHDRLSLCIARRSRWLAQAEATGAQESAQQRCLRELVACEQARQGIALMEHGELERWNALALDDVRAGLVPSPHAYNDLDDVQRHRLGAHEHAHIFQHHIVPAICADLRSWQAPYAVIVAAPPGSAWAVPQLHAQAQPSADGAPLYVTTEGLWAYHPEYAALLALGNKGASACVDTDASAWLHALVRVIIERRAPLVIHDARQSSDTTAQQLRTLREAGYRVELRAFALPDTLAVLDIHSRYEQQLEDCGVGAFTLAQPMLSAQHALPGTLERVVRDQLADRVTVYTHDQRCVWDKDGDQARYESAGEALQLERQRAATAAEKATHARRWSIAWDRKRARRAARPDVEVVRAHRNRALRELLSDPNACQLLRELVGAERFASIDASARAL